MSYATRGGGPASSINQLQDSGQYYGDKERRLLKSQPGKARGKGKPTGPSQTRGPDYRTKPVANDLLKQLLAEPGGIKQMSDAAQYGKLVEMRQKQAMLDRSEGAMREMQRVTQSMTAAQAAGVRAGQRPAGVSETVRRAVENVQARQRRDLETAGAQVQGRLPGQDETGRFVPGGARFLGADPVTSDLSGGLTSADLRRADEGGYRRGIGTRVNQERARQAMGPMGKGMGRGRGGR